MSDDQELLAGTGLVVVPGRLLPTIIEADTDDILGKLARKVAAFKPDVSTAKGRGEMRSLAAEISSAKMDLIRIGKGLTENWRKSTKAVNEECNILEERMNALRDRVRQQLTDYENAEKLRVAGHEDALARRLALTSFETPDPPSDLIRERLKEAEAPHVRDWQEFRERASDQRVGIIDNLTSMLAAAVKREADAAELERLRAEAAERERQESARLKAEHEAKIAAEAAERARVEAERKATEEAAAAERTAEAERQRILREAEERQRRADAEAAAWRLRKEEEIAEQKAKAEADRLAAAQREHEAHERAEAAERARVASEAKAKADAAEAARKAEEARVAAEQKAERDRIAAVEAERKRQADAKAAEEAAQRQREANKAHRTKINREALAALILCGLTEEQGIAVVTAIAKAEIPHIAITY